MNTQQAEIDVLKTQVKTLKRIVYGVVCLLVAGIALNACSESKSIPDLIQAKNFEVVNDEGKVMVGLAASPFGGLLSIKNKDKKIVAAIAAVSNGGTLRIYNKDEKNVVSLAADSEGGLLQINNKAEKLIFEKP